MGRDVIILDLRSLPYVTDFFVIAGATNPRQMRAIAEAIERELAVSGERAFGVEGTEESGWILLDFGDIVVHVFDSERRKLYDLELLWGDTPRLDWRDAAT